MKGFFCMALPLLLVALVVPGAWAGHLKVGYYENSCPQAEEIIKNVVARAVQSNHGIAAGIIRMHFHDCFVRGCDASVLLESTTECLAEKQHPMNYPSLRGFEIIDEAKAELESCCPNIVSCADVLAFAARDAAYYVGGFYYSLPGGRRDGTVSLAGEVGENLPPEDFNAEQLEENFARKGLSLEDMVVLSGAHSIGISHCEDFASRLYNFSATHSRDPSMDPKLADYLEKRCPPEKVDENSAHLDVATPEVLDAQYYRNLMKRRGLLTSDQTLWDSPQTSSMVAYFAENPMYWIQKYGEAMVRMGAIEVLTGEQGEIRQRCSVINSY